MGSLLIAVGMYIDGRARLRLHGICIDHRQASPVICMGVSLQVRKLQPLHAFCIHIPYQHIRVLRKLQLHRNALLNGCSQSHAHTCKTGKLRCQIDDLAGAVRKYTLSLFQIISLTTFGFQKRIRRRFQRFCSDFFCMICGQDSLLQLCQMCSEMLQFLPVFRQAGCPVPVGLSIWKGDLSLGCLHTVGIEVSLLRQRRQFFVLL